jgi:hypothetical protein
MKKISISLIILIASGLHADEKWVSPNPKLRYDQVTYLVSHNSYSTYEDGWILAQQRWNLKNQLANGIRALMPDIWTHDGTPNGAPYLCHGGCDLGHQLVTRGVGEFMRLQDFLFEVYEFLKANPKEIITFHVENYAQDALYIEVNHSGDQRLKGLGNLVYTGGPNEKGEWPTLEWLQNNNKRLIIFDSYGSTKFYYEWNYVIENQYSELDIGKACMQRAESTRQGATYSNRQLYLLNYFAGLTAPEFASANYNSYNTLWSLIKTCNGKVASTDKMPNFIALDFVNVGEPMKVVNELNRLALKKARAAGQIPVTQQLTRTSAVK